jgi:hypothetical protein
MLTEKYHDIHIYTSIFSPLPIYLKYGQSLVPKYRSKKSDYHGNKNNDKKVFIMLNPIHSLEFCKFDLLQLT